LSVDYDMQSIISSTLQRRLTGVCLVLFVIADVEEPNLARESVLMRHAAMSVIMTARAKWVP